jgi:phage tail sheath protein FI
MGQDTLITVEADLEPLNVRRLLILIRRLVLREGTRYVFQNISPTFQRQVARQFEYWMQQLLARGAFAGLSAQDSYQVIADQTVNPPDSIDQGRFIVQLLVAPSVPMRFLTVQLTQSDGQLSLLET